MSHMLADTIKRHKAGESVGVYSVCSAHPTVVEAAIAQAGADGTYILIAATSNQVVDTLGVPYRWVQSYVAGDKVYCVHEADDEEAIREHARRGGFPADLVAVVANEFGPQTAALAAS